VTGCDVIVIGAGVMGSATAWWLGRRGCDAVVVEQFGPAHGRGSSHGSTRIFRVAYPDPGFIDMARQAQRLWRQLEDESGAELLATTGGIDYGDVTSVHSITDALDRASVRYETVDAVDAAHRWPGLQFDGPVVHQPDAGRISAEAAVRTFQERARAHGVRLHFRERVLSLVPQHGDSVVVTTDAERYQARSAVVTAGPWVGDLLAGLGLVDLPTVTVTREQFFHFAPRVRDSAWPTFIHHGDRFVYGLPGLRGEGIKVAEHHTGAMTTAEERSFDIDRAGLDRVVAHVTRLMPGLDPTPLTATTCLYTNTADESFIIDRYGPIVVGSACSGHGFKFAPLIGQRVAELATGG
jgi:sarcosine oxidase